MSDIVGAASDIQTCGMSGTHRSVSSTAVAGATAPTKAADMGTNQVGGAPQGRGRKRARSIGTGSLEEPLMVLQAFLEHAPGPSHDAHALFQCRQRLQDLQDLVERRLMACAIESLTPHEAIEFIITRRVRLARVVKNDFEDNDEESQDEKDQVNCEHADGKKDRRDLIAVFQVGRGERLTMVLRVEGPSGPACRYSMELRLGVGRGESLLQCASWDQSLSEVGWQAWEELQARVAFDRRPVADFTRGVVLLGVLAALRRKFLKEESDSDVDAPGLVTSLSICGMMAEALLPTSEVLLSQRNASTAFTSATVPVQPATAAASSVSTSAADLAASIAEASSADKVDT